MNAAISSFDRTSTGTRGSFLRLRTTLRNFFHEVCEKAATLRYLEDVGGL
jgi:hypothetical protein